MVQTKADAAVAHHRLAAPRPGRPARQRAARRCTASSRSASGGWWGVGPRRLQGEVGRPARGAHRLHLRDHRRGARAGRHARRARPVRRDRLRRAAGRRRARPTRSCGCAAAGVTAWILVQALVNIGAVLGLLPITGVPLPLVSYGGSALLPTMLASGHAAVLRPASAAAGVARCCGGSPAPARPPGRRGSRMRVVVAGGGTAGHIEPALAFADALRRRDPTSAVTALGTERGLETRLDPGPRLRPRADPAGPDPAPPGTRPAARCRAGCGRRCGRRPTCCAAGSADVVVGFGGYVAGPAYLAARRRDVPDRRARGERRGPGWPTGSARGSRRTSRRPSRARRSPHAPSRRAADPARDRRPSTGPARRGRGARAPSGSTPTGRRCSCPAARRARAGSTRRRPGPRPALRGGGHPGAARDRPGQHVDVRGAAPARRRTSCVPYLDRMDLAYAAADLALCRAGRHHRERADRGRAAGGLRAAADRQRRAGAQRARRWSTPAAGCWSTTPTARRAGCARCCRRCSATRRGWPPMGAAAARFGRRDADERLVDLVLEASRSAGVTPTDAETVVSTPRRPAADSRCPPSSSGRVHFIGIGGAGHVRASRASCSPAGCRCPAATPRTPATLDGAAGARRDRPRRPRRRARRRRRHRGGLHRDPRAQPRAGRGPAPRAARRCTAPAALASVMVGRRAVAVAGTHGKTTTTSMLTVALQHCGADPSFAIGGNLNESGANAHNGSGDVFVAEADESDGSFLLYSPTAADRHQRRGRPPRPLRHRRGGRGGLRRVRRAGAAGRVPGRLRRRPRRAPAGRGRAARAASTCAPTARPADADLRLVGPARPAGWAARSRPWPAGRRLGAGPAAAARAAQRAQRRRRAGGRRRARASRRAAARGARELHRHPPAVRAQGHGRRGAGLRRLRPPPDRAGRRPGGRPRGGRRRPGGRRVPAAPVTAARALRRPSSARRSGWPTRSS